MKPVLWIVGASTATWLALAAFLDRATNWAILFGMLGPLLAVIATLLPAERIYQRHPEVSTSFMIAAFAAKLVFFGVYVTVVLKVLLLRSMPFVISFTSYFIVLYSIEALYLRRLYGRGMHTSR
jgi:hypothetical protein